MRGREADLWIRRFFDPIFLTERARIVGISAKSFYCSRDFLYDLILIDNHSDYRLDFI